jgi:hypothetical protein
MGGTIEGKFKVLHTVRAKKKLHLIAEPLGIKKASKKRLLSNARHQTFVVEKVRGGKYKKGQR